MTFDDAVRVCRAHFERKFPKTCTMCGRVFHNLPDYIRNTRHVGQPVSYDAALDDWTPTEPIGTYAMALCQCGTSVTLDSGGMSILTLWQLMRFARHDIRRSGETVSQWLVRLRVAIDRQALADVGEVYAGELPLLEAELDLTPV